MNVLYEGECRLVRYLGLPSLTAVERTINAPLLPAFAQTALRATLWAEICRPITHVIRSWNHEIQYVSESSGLPFERDPSATIVHFFHNNGIIRSQIIVVTRYKAEVYHSLGVRQVSAYCRSDQHLESPCHSPHLFCSICIMSSSFSSKPTEETTVPQPIDHAWEVVTFKDGTVQFFSESSVKSVGL